MFYSKANDFEPEDFPIGSSSVAHAHSVSYEEVSKPSSASDNLSEHSSDPPGPEMNQRWTHHQSSHTNVNLQNHLKTSICSAVVLTLIHLCAHEYTF